MMRARLAAFTLPILLLAGCASLSDGLYVIRHVDDPIKAKALIEQGIGAYDLLLVRRQQYERLAEVERHFAVALRYDPGNVEARQYLQMLDEFAATKVREKLLEAQAWLMHPHRQEEEEFALQVALQSVVRLDPGNEEAARLLKATAAARKRLVQGCIERSRAAARRARKEEPRSAADALSLESFRAAARAAAVDPRNLEARGQKNLLRREAARIFDRRLQAVRQLTEAGRFVEAQAQLAGLDELNAQLEWSRDGQMRGASFTLNLRRAEALCGRQDFEQAEPYATAALTFARTAEALELKQRIDRQLELADRPAGGLPARVTVQAPPARRAPAAKEPPPDPAAAFAAALLEVDAALAGWDIVGAKHALETADRTAKEPAQRDVLFGRAEKLRALVKAFYDRAVAAYRDERFKESIELLQAVVLVDGGYELAADYLDKAKAKQKLLDLY